jgi:hypothetical protein
VPAGEPALAVAIGLLAHQVGFGDQADEPLVVVDHRHTADVVVEQRGHDAGERRLRGDRHHWGGHHVADLHLSHRRHLRGSTRTGSPSLGPIVRPDDHVPPRALVAVWWDLGPARVVGDDQADAV